MNVFGLKIKKPILSMLFNKPSAELLKPRLYWISDLFFFFQVVLVLALETFVTIKAEVPFKEKRRQRNELREPW